MCKVACQGNGRWSNKTRAAVVPDQADQNSTMERTKAVGCNSAKRDEEQAAAGEGPAAAAGEEPTAAGGEEPPAAGGLGAPAAGGGAPAPAAALPNGEAVSGCCCSSC